MSLEEEIFETFFEKLKEAKTSDQFIDGLRKLWERGEMTSVEKIQELINGELSNGIKSK